MKGSELRRSFGVLAAGSALAKLIGFVREIVFAAAFGTGVISTGFRVSVTATLTPSNLVVSDIVSSGFAPAYTRARELDPARARATLRAYTVWVSGILGALSIAIFTTRSTLVRLLIPGAGSDVHEHASSFIAILAWTIPLFGLAQVASYALSAEGIHWGNGLRPTLQSIGLLLGTGLAMVTGQPLWLAIGFFVAWLAYVVACMSRLVALGAFGSFGWKDVTVGAQIVYHGIVAVFPLVILGGFVQASVLAERFIASSGPANLIASLDYAKMVADTATLVIAMPLGVLGLTRLPKLSRAQAELETGRMLSISLVLSVPFAILVAVFATPLTKVLFERGAFDSEDVSTTAAALVGLSLAVVPQGVVYVLSRVLAGRGSNRPVLLWGAIGLTAQLAVQATLIDSVGAYAIGIGIAVNALVVCVALAIVAGVGALLARSFLAWVGPIAITCFALLLVPTAPTRYVIGTLAAVAAAILARGVDIRGRARSGQPAREGSPE